MKYSRSLAASVFGVCVGIASGLWLTTPEPVDRNSDDGNVLVGQEMDTYLASISQDLRVGTSPRLEESFRNPGDEQDLLETVYGSVPPASPVSGRELLDELLLRESVNLQWAAGTELRIYEELALLDAHILAIDADCRNRDNV